MQSETKQCQNCHGKFVIDPDDFSFYEKIDILAPTFCPECRMIQRMAWRNERVLYKKKNSASMKEEEIVSMYSPDSKYSIFDKEYWWSDNWDPLDYGQEYDFSKPFFEQFRELLEKIPLPALQLMNSVNTQYSNYIDGNKNCYLVFGTGFSENLRYSNKSSYSKDSQDLLYSPYNELCFDLVNCLECSKLISSENCLTCFDSFFLYNCRNCHNCLGCSNLVDKSYCFFNKQYTKEEYEKKINLLKLSNSSNFEKLKNKFRLEIVNTSIRRFANIFRSVNCTGDNISDSKNCKYSFDILKGVEDSKYVIHSLDIKDNHDAYGTYKNELSYETLDCDVGMNNIGCITVYSSNSCSYSFSCQVSQNLFGCIGLKGKEYCILNKQYTKEEFLKLKSKIIRQMNEKPYLGLNNRIYKYGDFFPIEISPWSYNETIAQEYFPLAKERVINQGYKWKEKVERDYQIDLKNEEIPDDFNESIIGKVLECAHQGTCNEQCTEAFKIIEPEYQFYKRMNLPLPRLCPNCRHYQRLKQRNPLKLWHRSCMCDKENHDHSRKCEVEFETSYAPERPEVIYCEKCYQKEIY